jgi:hypothetical protein
MMGKRPLSFSRQRDIPITAAAPTEAQREVLASRSEPAPARLALVVPRVEWSAASRARSRPSPQRDLRIDGDQRRKELPTEHDVVPHSNHLRISTTQRSAPSETWIKFSEGLVCPSRSELDQRAPRIPRAPSRCSAPAGRLDRARPCLNVGRRLRNATSPCTLVQATPQVSQKHGCLLT